MKTRRSGQSDFLFSSRAYNAKRKKQENAVRANGESCAVSCIIHRKSKQKMLLQITRARYLEELEALLSILGVKGETSELAWLALCVFMKR